MKSRSDSLGATQWPSDSAISMRPSSSDIEHSELSFDWKQWFGDSDSVPSELHGGLETKESTDCSSSSSSTTSRPADPVDGFVDPRSSPSTSQLPPSSGMILFTCSVSAGGIVSEPSPLSCGFSIVLNLQSRLILVMKNGDVYRIDANKVKDVEGEKLVWQLR